MKLKFRYQYDGTVSALKCTNDIMRRGIRLANKKKTNGEKHISDLTKSLICALVDSGSQGTTTNHQWLLHKYKKINFEKYLFDAGKKMAHKVIGKGYTKISNGDGIYSGIHSWHTPTIPMTVISPGEVVHQHKKLYKSNTIYCDEDA
jgi:hypothetical protein